MKMILEVRGVKRYKGQPEAGGPSYDTTKLDCLLDVPTSKVPSPDADGSASVGEESTYITCGDVTHYTKLAEISYPAFFEVDLQPTTKGFEIQGYKFLQSFPKPVYNPQAQVVPKV